MAGFLRRFDSDPGDDVLLNIESVNILDLNPPGEIKGVGTGTVLMVAEMEDGPFNAPTEVTSQTDLTNTFGGFGYAYGALSAQNPCARQRFADAVVAPEFWNGNGMVQLSGKTFARLIICRADTSVGAVTFTRQAYLTGAAGVNFTLSTGQILALDIGAGPVSATFTGGAATVTAIGGVFPSTFVGGETLTLGYDAQANFQVTFLAADQSNAQVAARINQYAGFTFATLTGGQLTFTGVQKGTGGQVRVVSGSTGVLAQLGLTAATTAGTGNVANIASVKFSEFKTVVEAAVAGTICEQDANGNLRVSKVFAATSDTITVGAATTATAFGFAVGATNANAAGNAGTIPAGTVVQNTAGTRVFVTMQSIAVTAASAGPYTVKVRHATDDGTGLSATAGTVVKTPTPVQVDSYSVNNLALITACLTESAIDAAYVAAYATTTNINNVVRQANISFCARQSNLVRRTVRQNAIDASANGCFGRICAIRTPMNLVKSVAEGGAEPGVGPYRHQRTVFCYPQANTTVPAIGRVGLAGGTGFTADGSVDVGADGFLASVMSQLNPEENPGQDNDFLGAVNGLETGANVQNFAMPDYINLKAAGICALIVMDGQATFQSGVTSVDPFATPQLVNIARRRMADYIQDSLAGRGRAYNKKLASFRNRMAYGGEMRTFLSGLLSAKDPDRQRIAGFTMDPFKGNTPTSLAKGLVRYIINVRTLSSMDSIVLATTIGESVQVDEILPQAA